jgi:hypothetical protein
VIPSRRFILGAAGAAALSKIIAPWRPAPQDIVMAGEADVPEAVKANKTLLSWTVRRKEVHRITVAIHSMTEGRSSMNYPYTQTVYDIPVLDAGDGEIEFTIRHADKDERIRVGFLQGQMTLKVHNSAHG